MDATANPPQTESSAVSDRGLAFEIARKMIADRYGFWVNDSWSGQLTMRLEMRAAATGLNNANEYVHWLQNPEFNQAELTALVEGILNGETHFLRTAPHFDALLDKVVVPWRSSRAPEQRLRIASLGCSTGEEPYSMALVLHELLSQEELADVEITGVDLNNRSLAFARAGSFDSFQLRDLSRRQWQRWFTPDQGNRWLIHPSLRASVRFLQHNLLNPLPFAGLDAIFCRNVMIYFKRPVAASCFREIHAALRPGGFLFLGHAESAFAYPEYFEPVQVPDGVIYQKKSSPALTNEHSLP
jgi:chemotaxis protein methyltransferase CheR